MFLCFLELHLEEQNGHAGKADPECQAETIPDAAPSLLIFLQGTGGDTLVETEIGEACQIHKHCDNISYIMV